MFQKLIIALVFLTIANTKHINTPPKQEDHKDVHTASLTSYPSYKYSYGVEDFKTGDYKNQKEERDGDVVRGEYTVADPDGTIRTVTYTVDKKSGFNAVVTKSKGEENVKTGFEGFKDLGKEKPEDVKGTASGKFGNVASAQIQHNEINNFHKEHEFGFSHVPYIHEEKPVDNTYYHNAEDSYYQDFQKAIDEENQRTLKNIQNLSGKVQEPKIVEAKKPQPTIVSQYKPVGHEQSGLVGQSQSKASSAKSGRKSNDIAVEQKPSKKSQQGKAEEKLVATPEYKEEYHGNLDKVPENKNLQGVKQQLHLENQENVYQFGNGQALHPKFFEFEHIPAVHHQAPTTVKEGNEHEYYQFSQQAKQVSAVEQAKTGTKIVANNVHGHQHQQVEKQQVQLLEQNKHVQAGSDNVEASKVIPTTNGAEKQIEYYQIPQYVEHRSQPQYLVQKAIVAQNVAKDSAKPQTQQKAKDISENEQGYYQIHHFEQPQHVVPTPQKPVAAAENAAKENVQLKVQEQPQVSAHSEDAFNIKFSPSQAISQDQFAELLEEFNKVYGAFSTPKIADGNFDAKKHEEEVNKYVSDYINKIKGVSQGQNDKQEVVQAQDHQQYLQEEEKQQQAVLAREHQTYLKPQVTQEQAMKVQNHKQYLQQQPQVLQANEHQHYLHQQGSQEQESQVQNHEQYLQHQQQVLQAQDHQHYLQQQGSQEEEQQVQNHKQYLQQVLQAQDHRQLLQQQGSQEQKSQVQNHRQYLQHQQQVLQAQDHQQYLQQVNQQRQSQNVQKDQQEVNQQVSQVPEQYLKLQAEYQQQLAQFRQGVEQSKQAQVGKGVSQPQVAQQHAGSAQQRPLKTIENYQQEEKNVESENQGRTGKVNAGLQQPQVVYQYVNVPVKEEQTVQGLLYHPQAFYQYPSESIKQRDALNARSVPSGKALEQPQEYYQQYQNLGGENFSGRWHGFGPSAYFGQNQEYLGEVGSQVHQGLAQNVQETKA